MSALTQNKQGSRVVALSGGIGGAKLALGLKRVLARDALTVIANTADDFEHFGLAISPDIDTLVYTLSGLADTTRGWGRQDETWDFMDALAKLGGATWFNLGDRDLAMHVWRTAKLAVRETLSDITIEACMRLDVGAEVLPMSDQPVRTMLETDDGLLDFQDYFVARRAEPRVRSLAYAGIDSAQPAPRALEAVTDTATAAIVICPSNPLISIEPILAVPKFREALRDAKAPVIAVSPIIAGEAVKGPTAKMMQELDLAPTAEGVLTRYGGLIDSYIVDPRDADACEPVAAQHDVEIIPANIMMVSLDDRDMLAQTVLSAAQSHSKAKR